VTKLIAGSVDTAAMAVLVGPAIEQVSLE